MVGRKGLHTCQKYQTVVRIPGRAAQGLIPTQRAPTAWRQARTAWQAKARTAWRGGRPARRGRPGGTEGLAGVGPDGPEGDPHAWYQRGLELLSRGSPAAAAQILQRAVAAEPGSRSVREALARAQFDARRYTEAAGNFRLIVEASPADDYAHFGLGLSLVRPGNPRPPPAPGAAAAMRPDAQHYTNALLAVRATLHSRPAGRTERSGAEAGTTESREDD